MITIHTYPNALQLHTQYKAIEMKEAETRMKQRANHTCNNSQMVASHLTKAVHKNHCAWKQPPTPTSIPCKTPSLPNSGSSSCFGRT